MPGRYSKPVYILNIPWQAYELCIVFALAIFFVAHRWSHLHGGAFAFAIRLLSGLAFLTIFYGSFIEPRLLKIRRYVVGRVKAADAAHAMNRVKAAGAAKAIPRSFRVAFLSDIHVGPYKGEKWVRRLVHRTNGLKPDLILLGGDFLYGNADALPALAPLKDLKAPLGVYAILGNHDEWKARQESKSWFEASGIPLLLNRSLRIDKDGRTISVAGADDDWYGETDLAAAFKDIAPDDLAVIMLHNPDLAVPSLEMLKDRPGPTFIFSGHTHGGQIRLPWWGSVMRLPHHLGRKYDRGVFDFSGIPLVIGAGAGESGPRARLFCPPEIVLATLQY